jgi:hypothetical protein
MCFNCRLKEVARGWEESEDSKGVTDLARLGKLRILSRDITFEFR